MSADEGCTSLNGLYTTASGTQYTVDCQYDHYGGDFGNASASTFTQCFSICDSTVGCDGFAYHPSLYTCYMKSLPFSSGDFNADSDWAQKAVAASSSLTSSMSTPSSTPSSVLQSTTSIPQSETTAVLSSSAAAPTSSSTLPTVSTSIGATSTTATSSANITSSTSANASPVSTATPSSSITLDEKIALGVGLGIGLPSLLIAGLSYMRMRPNKE